MKRVASLADRVSTRLKYAHFPYVSKALMERKKVSSEPLRILDVGCGPGNLSAFCGESEDCEWYGLDLWGHELRQAAEKKIYKALFQVNLVHGLPFRDRSFDVIVCSEVLMYLPNVGETLAEFHRVLGPEGRVFVHNPISWLPRLFSGLKKTWRCIYREKGAVILDKQTAIDGGRRVCRVTYYSFESLQREILGANFQITDVAGFRLFRNRIRLMTRLEDFTWYHKAVRAIVDRYPAMASDVMVVGVKKQPAPACTR
jgi:2-polyprenyl-3-methyl-5-hydroxy-6-metoxy-1,4-benzoquinol methylase